jgi:hypothetical protein
MLIQFDREDSENLVVTFDNSESDAEQMQDFIAWLEASELEFSKLKMKIPGVTDKVTNLFVKKAVSKSKQVVSTPKQVVLPVPVMSTKQVVQPPPPAPVEEESEDTETAHLAAKDVSSDSESDSESEAEPVSRTKKTTKRTTKATK